MLQGWTEVVTPVTGTESVKFIKAPAVWMIRVLHTVVVFTKHARAITSQLKDLTDRLLIQIHPFASRTGTKYSAARVITPRQKLGPSRRANRTNIETIKGSSLSSQSINIGCAEIGVPIETQISPTLIIRKHHYDVGL
jgi:hypothetical protein